MMLRSTRSLVSRRGQTRLVRLYFARVLILLSTAGTRRRVFSLVPLEKSICEGAAPFVPMCCAFRAECVPVLGGLAQSIDAPWTLCGWLPRRAVEVALAFLNFHDIYPIL